MDKPALLPYCFSRYDRRESCDIPLCYDVPSPATSYVHLGGEASSMVGVAVMTMKQGKVITFLLRTATLYRSPCIRFTFISVHGVARFVEMTPDRIVKDNGKGFRTYGPIFSFDRFSRI